MPTLKLVFLHFQLSAGGGDRLSAAPCGQFKGSEGCADTQQLGVG